MHSVLLQNVEVLSPQSQWHLQRVDIRIREGKLAQIAPTLSPEAYEAVQPAAGLCVSHGWLDLFAVLQEPGYEHKDTLAHFTKSAAFGGFTEVLAMPNTLLVGQSRAAMQQLRSYHAHEPVRLHPVGAATLDAAGKEMSELYDLHEAGARAFSDGTHALEQVGVMQRILLYLQPFGGVLLNKPALRDLAPHGQMHEGIVSTALGLPGIPSLAEEMAISRDLALVAYTGGRLHFTHVSTANGVALIRAAKQDGLAVTADVAAHQLYFTDEALHTFDTNYKVLPPFRTAADVAALWDGLADDTLDAVVSGHHPQDPESKQLEFDLAEFGIVGLETAFACANFARPAHVSVPHLLTKFVEGPRRVLNMPCPPIEEGAEANLTLFHPDEAWTFARRHIQSKSVNTPFVGKPLKGRARATFLGNQSAHNSI